MMMGMTTRQRRARAEETKSGDERLTDKDILSNVSLSSLEDDDGKDDDDKKDSERITTTRTTTIATTPQGRKARRRVVTPSSSSSSSSSSWELQEGAATAAALLVSPLDDDDDDKGTRSKALTKRSRKRGFSSKRGRRRSFSPRKRLSFTSSRDGNDDDKEDDDKEDDDKIPEAAVVIPAAVKKVYGIVTRTTGSLGGNGHGGAIYGELTMGSMAKMVHLMKTHCGLDSHSRFIDIGCGLGKPNFYVAQDPRVAFSFGIEMEHVRWTLGLSNWHAILQGMVAQQQQQEQQQDEGENKETFGYRCVLQHGNITQAQTLDPFTHIYMFDIGFPPALFETLSRMFQRSTMAEYLCCFHGPRVMITKYQFPVQLMAQTPTRMHGSLEVHTGYVYRRISTVATLPKTPPRPHDDDDDVPCDTLFQEAWKEVQTCSSASFMARQVRERLHQDCFGEGTTTTTSTTRLQQPRRQSGRLAAAAAAAAAAATPPDLVSS